jgi:hypothetical protein
MKFIVRYELARIEFETYEVEVEAPSVFEADVKVRDINFHPEGVDKPRFVEKRLGPASH